MNKKNFLPNYRFSFLIIYWWSALWAKESVVTLTHFQSMFHFYIPENGFLMFSRGIEVEHWLKIDQKCLTYLPLFHLFCYQQNNTTTFLVHHSPEIEDCFRKATLRCNIFVFIITLQKQKNILSMVKVPRQEKRLLK